MLDCLEHACYDGQALLSVKLEWPSICRGVRIDKATSTTELSFVVAQCQQDETTVLTQAVREGIHTLCREAMIEAYMPDRSAREEVLTDTTVCGDACGD